MLVLRPAPVSRVSVTFTKSASVPAMAGARAKQGSMYFLVLFITLIKYASSQECPDSGINSGAPLKFRDLISECYDKLKPPVKNGEPVNVGIKISILNIQYVDEVRQTYAADIFFHQVWKDERIKIPPSFNSTSIVLDNSWKNHLWRPDIYFKNSLDGKVTDIVIPYSYIVLDQDSNLFFAARVSLKLSCEMDLAAYPHDVQECHMSIMSLQHKNDTVVLYWRDFALTSQLMLAQYYVRGRSQEDCTKSYDIGTYSCLLGKIKLARRLGYFLINKYIPCVLIVCMSFVTFWVPAEAYPARVTLSVTSLLTIVTQQYQSSMPSVSYVVALNIWMLSCIGFVFVSLLEYAVVIGLMNQGGANLCPFHKFKRLFSLHKAQTVTDGGTGSDKSPRNRANGHSSENPPERMSHRSVDRISRIVFPLFFFTFAVCYWFAFSRV